MAKTLSESAAEILNASMKAGKEPLAKSDAEVQDLGGATTDNPGGNEVGKEAAASTAEAPEPGVPSNPADKKGNPAGTGTGAATTLGSGAMGATALGGTSGAAGATGAAAAGDPESSFSRSS